MAEPVRRMEAGPQRQAAGQPPLAAPPAGRPPHRLPVLSGSLWQESSESTNTTIEDEDTKGRGALPLASGPPGPLGPPPLTAPGLKGPQCQLVAPALRRTSLGSFQTGCTVSGRGTLGPLGERSWTFLIAGVVHFLCCVLEKTN